MAKKSKGKGKKNEAEAPTVRKTEGMVIRNTGLLPGVLTSEGDVIDCRVKGTFRLRGIRTTNPVAVGDRVKVSVNADSSAYITDIEPRTNYIIRRASNLSKEASILAANVDQACLIVTLTHPTTSTTFIDRFLATAEAYRVPAIIVINKTDLLDRPFDFWEKEEDSAEVLEDEGGEATLEISRVSMAGTARGGTDSGEEEQPEHELLDAVTYLYESVGYKVVHVSCRTGEGVERLRGLLDGKITLLSGNSGVGKSTLVNELIPGLNLRTAQISHVHDTGMHTTTFSEMFALPDNRGWLIDTPGVRGFGTIEFDRYEISHFFPEIFKLSSGCRYGNCTHTHEPACAVREALFDHRIAQSRYSSYLSILQDSEEDKYRKPF